MQKTIKEWLSELPEPYRSKALANLESCGFNDALRTIKFDKCETLLQAVDNGFEWDKTPEGHAYWEDLSEALAEGTFTGYSSKPPTCAIEALMTIALKKGFPVENIESIKKWTGNHLWGYTLVGNTDEWFYIELATNAT